MKLRSTLITIGLALLVAVVVLAQARCQSIPVEQDERLESYRLDPWAAVLEAVVRDGLVDYGLLEAEHEHALNRYVESLGRFGPKLTPQQFPDDDAKLAYYLNAYNAIMLRKWLDAGAATAEPDAKVNLLWFVFEQWRVDGEWMSLDHLEQQVIRKRFDEPRIHFALVCGAMDCPPLRAEPYVGDRLDEQLDDQGRRWFAEPDSVRLTDDGRLWVSAIFFWYSGDIKPLGNVSGMVDRYVADDRPEKQSMIDAARDGAFIYGSYDWTINDVANAPTDEADER